MIAISPLLLPPVRDLVYSKTSKKLSIKTRGILISVLFICSVIIIGQVQEKEAEELAIKEANFLKQKKENYYNSNREKIISSLNKSLKNKDYDSVILEAKKYEIFKDKDIKEIVTKAEQALKIEKRAKNKAKKVKKEKELLAKLKYIKSTEYKKNLDVYTQLNNLYPSNNKYEDKLKYYSNKLKKETVNKLQTQLGLKWNYQKSIDKISNKTIRYALVYSLNTLNFDFPYQGSQRALLQLRKHPRYGHDVILSIERGQFTCSYNSCKVTVRFDKGKPIRYRATESSDYSTTELFINDYKGFVKRAKKSKKIYIEAEFYQEGFKVLEFDSEGLKF